MVNVELTIINDPPNCRIAPPKRDSQSSNVEFRINTFPSLRPDIPFTSANNAPAFLMEVILINLQFSIITASLKSLIPIAPAVSLAFKFIKVQLDTRSVLLEP